MNEQRVQEHYGEDGGETLPLFEGFLAKRKRVFDEQKGKVQTILESSSNSDAGFSCPSCGEYTETTICSHCGALLGTFGELDLSETDLDSKSVLLDEEEPFESQKEQSILWGGEIFHLFEVKTVEGTDIFIKFRYNKVLYKVVFKPHAKKMVQKVLVFTGNSFKKELISKNLFNTFVSFLKEISTNPHKYNLSHLKALKK